MAADDRIRVSLRRSTVEMIRGFDPDAPTLDDAIEEMLVAKPPRALVKELDRRERGKFVSREEARHRHGY
ncbi:MAG TPA: hypothetical protein VKT21_05590 [Thermoplasmata archaeon]|nr:hypothetical protein [Thermoplasmata archaeon]